MDNSAISSSLTLPLHSASMHKLLPCTRYALLLQPKKMETVACMRFAGTLKSNFCCNPSEIVFLYEIRLFSVLQEPNTFTEVKSPAPTQLDQSLLKTSGNTHPSSRAGPEPRKPLLPSWQTEVPLKCSLLALLCGRGRLQVGARIYSTPLHQVVPPYWQWSKPIINSQSQKSVYPALDFWLIIDTGICARKGLFAWLERNRECARVSLFLDGSALDLGCPSYSCGVLQAHIYPATG